MLNFFIHKIFKKTENKYFIINLRTDGSQNMKVTIPKGFELVFKAPEIFPYEPDSAEGKKVLKNTTQKDLRKNYCFELKGLYSGDNKKTGWFYWIVPEKKHDKSGDTRNTFKVIPKQYLPFFHKDLKKKHKDYLENPYEKYLYEKTGHIIFNHRYLE